MTYDSERNLQCFEQNLTISTHGQWNRDPDMPVKSELRSEFITDLESITVVSHYNDVNICYLAPFSHNSQALRTDGRPYDVTGNHYLPNRSTQLKSLLTSCHYGSDWLRYTQFGIAVCYMILNYFPFITILITKSHDARALFGGIPTEAALW